MGVETGKDLDHGTPDPADVGLGEVALASRLPLPSIDLQNLPSSPVNAKWPPFIDGVSLRFRRIDPDTMAVPTYDARLQIRPPGNLDAQKFGTLLKEEAETVVFERKKLTGNSFRTSIGLEWVLDSIPPQIGNHFQAHGFAKGIEGLVPLLENGVQGSKHLYSMNLARSPEASGGLGASQPYTKDGVFVVGACGNNNLNTSGGIKYVIVGEELINAIDMLNDRFGPNVKILAWHAAPAVLRADFIEIHPGRNAEVEAIVSSALLPRFKAAVVEAF